MRAEVVAIGTELLLGYIVDTNSAWIGEQLAAAGIDCLLATKVGDNTTRIATAIRDALGRAETVICCGGLGPTQDDVTREAIAEVMGVDLERDPALEEQISQIFRSYGVEMTGNNLRQADVPVGAGVIAQTRGTAPGLICPVGDGVVYAVPGVPAEMREMVTRAVLPDLARRSGTRSVIASRTLRTWGMGESAVSEILAPRLAALDAAGNPAIAFLASAAEGVKVRLTAKVVGPEVAGAEVAGAEVAGAEALGVEVAGAEAEAVALLDAEEHQVRALLGDRVFGVDDQTLERVVADLLVASGGSLAVAESLTGGFLASRLTDVPGASGWFRGGVVSYATAVKQQLLDVPEGPVVSAAAAEAMAAGVARLLGADAGIAVTGVAGPDEQEGQPVGTVWIGSWVGGVAMSRQVRLPGQRPEVRLLTVGSALDHLRRRLLGLPL